MMFKQKNKIFKYLIFSFFILFLLIDFSTLTNCNPDEDPDDFDDCHESGDYKISSNSDEQIEVNKGEDFSIDITGRGLDLILCFNPVSVDNDDFKADLDDSIEDNSKYDENEKDDIIYVNYTLTAPEKVGTYKILFYVKSPPNKPPGKPYIDFIEFEVIVEKPTDLFSWEQIYKTLINHYNIYLGAIAIICLGAATLLYHIDHRKYIRTHGILSAFSLIFTSINTYFILTETFLLFFVWLDPTTIDLLHLLHIFLGVVGYVACIIAALAGISGIKHVKYGYIALGCWGFNFIFGMIYWGVGLV